MNFRVDVFFFFEEWMVVFCDVVGKHLFKFFRKHGLDKKETIEPQSRALEISLVVRNGEFIFLRDNPGECGILLVMVGSGVENDDVVPFKRL